MKASPAARRARVLAATTAAAALAGAGLVLAPAPASAVDGTVTVATAVARTCQAAPAEGAPGTATRSLQAGADGLLRLTLGAPGDWDVAAFDRRSGQLVASSAGFGGTEVATGYVVKGQDLLVQACRQPGAGATAALRSDLEHIAAGSAPTVSVVEVATRDRAAKGRLQSLGLDLTEHGTQTSVQALLFGAGDAQKLRDAGFTYRTVIADLAARDSSNRAADRAYAAATPRSGLPSGRTTYRRLGDYETEMKALAARYPDLVRPLTLPHRTAEGREVHGIEITARAADTADGKPVFLNMGVHHAREWPAGEHPMEWAYELLQGYGSDPALTRVVEQARTIVVPVVNPDGFTVSREAGSVGPNKAFSAVDYEYKRKNCQISVSTPRHQARGTCADNLAGRYRGDDPNRNYGAFWGGPGSSASWQSDVFRGDAPFSAPEVQNVRELVSSRSVTGLITNHTYSNLVLRVPGVYAVRPPLEEPQYKALGDAMAAHNGYRSQPGWALYDTTGSTEDWSFFNTGGFGFTFEIGPDEFHPEFAQGVVAEYLGGAGTAGAGRGGNRAAYLTMAQATLDPALHSTLVGTAPPGATLTVRKSYQGHTATGATYADTLTSSYRSDGGRFRWAVNPSTRPLVAGRYGRDPLGPPQAAQSFNNPPGVPATNTALDPRGGDHESFAFQVQGPQDGVDNGTARVRLEWADPAVDWDLFVYDAAGELVAEAASYGRPYEEALMVDPLPGTYTLYVVNYWGGRRSDWTSATVTYASPLPEERTGVQEAWQLTCTLADGSRSTRAVVVDRGQQLELGKACLKAKQQEPAAGA